MNEEIDMPLLQQKESIKLMRSVSGKIGWEIKLLSGTNIDEEIKRLENINNTMKTKFDNVPQGNN